MSTGAIIQARLNSKRFPLKTIMEIPPNSGVTVLEWVYLRLRNCKSLDKIVLTTPDKKLYDFADSIGLKCVVYNGPRNVMKEYIVAAETFGIKTIIRITADCPLIDPDIVSHVLLRHDQHNNDYTYNRCDENGGGDGLDVEVFNLDSLITAYSNNPTPYELEHVTASFRNHSDLFKIEILGSKEFEGCSLDTIEDYHKISNYIRRNRWAYIQAALAQDGMKTPPI